MKTTIHSSGMQLLLNAGIFYEFIPFNSEFFDEQGSLIDQHKAFTLSQVKENIDYAIVLTTNAGLWRYMLGDLVRFTNVEDREIKISLPPSYSKNKNQQYPLLILLDGDFLFDPFYGTLSYGYYWDDLPEVIIVGVNQNKGNEREYDSQFDENGIPTESGAKFFEFLGIELIFLNFRRL